VLEIVERLRDRPTLAGLEARLWIEGRLAEEMHDVLHRRQFLAEAHHSAQNIDLLPSVAGDRIRLVHRIPSGRSYSADGVPARIALKPRALVTGGSQVCAR
jgi:hypothetical protein